MAMPSRKDTGQLDLFEPPVDGWWYADFGSAQVYVIADDASDAQHKAEAELRDMGVLPGGPPGLHESWRRMCEFARGGRGAPWQAPTHRLHVAAPPLFAGLGTWTMPVFPDVGLFQADRRDLSSCATPGIRRDSAHESLRGTVQVRRHLQHAYFPIAGVGEPDPSSKECLPFTAECHFDVRCGPVFVDQSV